MSKPARTILITAGPTVEDIDPVRFLSNRATGTLGFAAARQALAMGHQVVLVHGPVCPTLIAELEKVRGAKRRLTRRAIRSCEDMHRQVHREIKDCDIVIMTAAVADFRPAKRSSTKLKKGRGAGYLKLEPTVDILKSLGHLKESARKDLTLIGFALETGSGKGAGRLASRIGEARRKRKSKNLDAIVLDTPAEMGATRGTFRLLTSDDKAVTVLKITKQQLARRLIALGCNLWSQRNPGKPESGG